jgi:hypothetical protein
MIGAEDVVEEDVHLGVIKETKKGSHGTIEAASSEACSNTLWMWLITMRPSSMKRRRKRRKARLKILKKGSLPSEDSAVKLKKGNQASEAFVREDRNGVKRELSS